MRILFVCTGNINRSAAAHVICQSLVPDWKVTSAATNGVANKPMAKKMRVLLESLGYDPSGHRSSALTSETLEGIDLVVGFQPSHLNAVRAMGGNPILITDIVPEYRHLTKVPDPAFDSSGFSHQLTVDIAHGLVRCLADTQKEPA